MTCTAALTIGYIVCQTQWGQVIKPADYTEYAQPVLEGRPAPARTLSDLSAFHKASWSGLTDQRFADMIASYGPYRGLPPVDWSKVKGYKP